MSVPKFGDIGKPVKDLLTKDFPYNESKLEVKTVAPNGVTFTTSGSKTEAGVYAEIKEKFSHKASGVTCTSVYTSNNLVKLDAEGSNFGTDGTNFELNTVLSPFIPGKQDVKVKLGYDHEMARVSASVDVLKAKPVVNADLSVGTQGVVAGAKIGAEVGGEITAYDVAGGYTDTNFSLAFNILNKLSEFSGSYFHKINSTVQVGCKFTWSKKIPDKYTKIEFASKHQLDQFTSVKFRLDTAGQIGLGYCQKLRPGTTLTVGALVHATKLESKDHKIGFTLSMDQ